MRRIFITAAVGALLLKFPGHAEVPRELRVGVAGHAFDHLGGFAEQAEAAAASGANIIYATGLGAVGYSGLPPAEELARQCRSSTEYVRQAKSRGIRLALGYLCATSIVKLESFDANWSPEFRARFHTPPADWRQQDRDGKPLASWYGGDYQPACMNHPDWRTYEKFMVRQQLESGHDGVFFDNPTVHPQGCYCPHCLEKFSSFLQREGTKVTDRSVAALRQLARQRTNDFLRFRCAIARDFLAEMRRYARSLNPRALMTCNNSLNSVEVFYSQSRGYGYNIFEMSQAEDLVVVEDMGNQPRTLANGQTLEYGPTYELLHAISHGKPVVAVTIADADYHTPPNLVRLAQAEAAAHNASYLSWPTWPENVRERMQATIRPQADFLGANEKLLNNTRARRDVVLFLPFRRWLETNVCAASQLATALTRANVQYGVRCEDNFTAVELKGSQIVLVENLSVFSPGETAVVEKFQRQGGRVITAVGKNWLEELQRALPKPAVTMHGPVTVRAVVRDQRARTLVHLLNLDVQKLSSFADHVTPAADVRLTCRVPTTRVRSVRALTG
ncbi:MAG: hypothetical protein EXS35_02540, partial [Pedosphaera sp.]|nr:hypothetical protein [Pedosphaera sp.]